MDFFVEKQVVNSGCLGEKINSFIFAAKINLYNLDTGLQK